MALIIGSNLFVHAGILENIATKYNNIKDINKLLSLYLWNRLTEVNKYNDLFEEQNSPLWTRAFGNLGIKNNITDNECDTLLKPLEQTYKVGKIFVGHTPLLTKGITGLCNNKIWLTDYGASNAFNLFDNTYLDNTNLDRKLIHHIDTKEVMKFRTKDVMGSIDIKDEKTTKNSYNKRHLKRRPHVLEIVNDNEFKILY